MASIAEQIAEAVRTALYNNIVAVGTRVWRAREDAVDRSECPAIVVRLESERTEQADLAAETEQNALALTVAIHVADGETDPYETAADAIAVSAHALIRAATYPGDTGPPQRIGRRWQGVSGDASPGLCEIDYEFVYFNATSGLDVAG